jgi:hypothetical protein
MIGTLIYGVVTVAAGRTDLMNKLIERCTPAPRPGGADLLAPPRAAPPPINVLKEE